MDKGLDLQLLRNIVADLTDLLEGQLTGRHYTLGPQLMPEPIGTIVGIIGLGADVQFHLRQHFFGDGKYTGIGDDQRIGADLSQLFKILAHAIQILIMRQDIGSHIYFYAVFMGKSDTGSHVFHGEIFRLGTQTKSLSSNVHGIRAVDHRSL